MHICVYVCIDMHCILKLNLEPSPISPVIGQPESKT